MGQHDLTNQQADLIAQLLKCCYGHSEMPGQSLSSKYFCIIASQDCYITAFPNSKHLPPKAMTKCIVVPYRDTGYSPYYVKCFECLEKRYINVTNHYYYCVYLVTSPVSVYQEVTILLSLTHQMEMCLFTNVFCGIQIFAHKLNSQL